MVSSKKKFEALEHLERKFSLIIVGRKPRVDLVRSSWF